MLMVFRNTRRVIHLGWAIVSLAVGLMSVGAQAQQALPLTGKVALVTGSTDGLGREVAQRLGALGAHVLIHGRNAERGAEVVAAINDGPGSAQFYAADFGSLQQVRDLVANILLDHQSLHLLINNAGIASGFNDGEKALSDDGYEMIFQVNFLSHYLLTDLLLPILQASAPARIVNVASAAQRMIDFDDVANPADFNASEAYAHSKLAQVMHAFHIAGRLQGTNVTFNALHPATLMDTSMVREMGVRARSSVDEGATAVMQLAVGDALAGQSGLYFNGLQPSRAHNQAYDDDARRRLDALARRLAEVPPVP